MNNVIDHAISMIREGKTDEAVQYLSDLSKPLEADLFNSPQAIVGYCQSMSKLKHEELSIILLDSKNRLIKKVKISKGTVDRAVIYPREIFRYVLLNHAAGFVVVHNHPSGDPQSSSEDDLLTKKIKLGAAALDLRLVDHVIIGKNYAFYSYVKEQKL